MEEFNEYVTFTVKTAEGEEVELAVIDEFEFEKKNYVSAAKVIDDTIDDTGMFIYRVKIGADDFQVEKITDKEEYDKVIKAYMEL